MIAPSLRFKRQRQTRDENRRIVLAVLHRHADKDGRCAPSRQSLTCETHQSRSTVNRCLADLERLGLIRSEPRRSREGGDLSRLVTVLGWPEDRR